MKGWIVCLAAVVCGSLWTSEASAQGYSNYGNYRNYRPGVARWTGSAGRIRPTLSPYLDLYRNGQGAMPNYHQFVRPQLRLQQILDQQNYQSRSIGYRTGRVETDLVNWASLMGDPGTGPVQSYDWARKSNTISRPTGVGARFDNTGHFYGGRR